MEKYIHIEWETDRLWFWMVLEFDKTVDKFRQKGYSEIDSIIQTLNLFKTNYNIDWRKL